MIDERERRTTPRRKFMKASLNRRVPWTLTEIARSCEMTVHEASRYAREMIADGRIDIITVHGREKFIRRVREGRPSFTGRPKNIFQAIMHIGHDEDFEHADTYEATAAMPGTQEKIDVMRHRIELGQNPHHPNDARYYKPGGERENLDLRLAVHVGSYRNRKGKAS